MTEFSIYQINTDRDDNRICFLGLDKLITLSTCEYSRNNSRLVVVAKRITEDGGADAAKTHAEATAEGERPN